MKLAQSFKINKKSYNEIRKKYLAMPLETDLSCEWVFTGEARISEYYISCNICNRRFISIRCNINVT